MRAARQLSGVFALLLLAQVSAAQRDTSTYSSPALRALIAQAARINAIVPATLGGYRATVESEIAMGVRTADGREVPVSLEQVAAQISYRRTGEFTHHIIGYRTPIIGLGALAGFYERSWVVPTLYGNRIGLLWGGPDSARAARGVGALPGGGGFKRDSAPVLHAVHPLAADRDQFYRFSGGDTVEVIKVDNRSIRIVHIDVQPRDSIPPRSLVFGGDIELDVDRRHIVRMRGAFYRVGGAPEAGRLARVMPARLIEPLQLFSFVDIVNSEVNQDFWLPQYQRWELQIAWPVLGDSRYVYRIVSHVRDFVVTPPDTAGAGATDQQVVRFHGITTAGGDSLGNYHDWNMEVGKATSAVDADDFQRVGPDRWRPTGRPLATLQGDHASDLVHFNRIEGWYTGVGGNLRLRDAAPGLTLRAAAGYAWSENAVRGRASAEYQRGRWTFAVRGGRSLDITNDFRNRLDSGNTFAALFGSDRYDYVDRYSFGGSVTRNYSRRRALLRAELGLADDHVAVNHRTGGVFGNERFLPNRGIDPGRYVRSAATIELHPGALVSSQWPGVGVSLSYLRGDGDLDFQRTELTVQARHISGLWTLVARVNAGALFASTPAPQQLFEIGGEHGVPGYGYKQFAGDRAVVSAGSIAYHINLWRTPHVLLERKPWRPGLVLPGVAPVITVHASTGWTDASSPAAAAAIARLGPRMPFDPKAIDPFAPASTITGNPRTSVGASLLFFNGTIGISTARAVDHRAPWRLRIGFGEVY